MKTFRVSEARANLYKLIDETSELHEPIKITGKRNNAIIIGEEDWRAVEETLYLLSMPNVRKSIIKGMKTPIKKCVSKVTWPTGK
jgi:prevent-host-death family protein